MCVFAFSFVNLQFLVLDMGMVVELGMDEVEDRFVDNSFEVDKMVVELEKVVGKDKVLDMDIVVVHKQVVVLDMVSALELLLELGTVLGMGKALELEP